MERWDSAVMSLAAWALQAAEVISQQGQEAMEQSPADMSYDVSWSLLRFAAHAALAFRALGLIADPRKVSFDDEEEGNAAR